MCTLQGHEGKHTQLCIADFFNQCDDCLKIIPSSKLFLCKYILHQRSRALLQDLSAKTFQDHFSMNTISPKIPPLHLDGNFIDPMAKCQIVQKQPKNKFWYITQADTSQQPSAKTLSNFRNFGIERNRTDQYSDGAQKLNRQTAKKHNDIRLPTAERLQSLHSSMHSPFSRHRT